MLVRRVARPLLASWYVREGLDALRDPAPHAERARRAVALVADRVPPGTPLSTLREPSQRQLVTLVRAHAAATVVAGLLVGLGRAPRTAALVLAALTLPTAVSNLPDKAADAGDPVAKRERRDRLVRALAFTGAAVLAAADHEGRPGMAWRLEHARAERARTHARVAAAKQRTRTVEHVRTHAKLAAAKQYARTRAAAAAAKDLASRSAS